MNEKLKQFFERIKKVSLKADEKSFIKKELVRFVDRNSIPYSDSVDSTKYVKSNYIKSTLIIFKRPMTALIIGLILLGSGATSFAAEQAVPGDTLYPVKVSVNEKIVDKFKVSDEAKANWEAKKAERRIKEVQKIIKKGKINSETDAIVVKLEGQFDAHTAKVNKILADLEKSGDTEKALRISKKFEDILNSQEDLLREISDKNINPGDTDERVLEHIGNVTEDIAQNREDNEEKIAESNDGGFEEVVQEKLQDLKEQISETESYINEIKQDVNKSATDEALNRLGKAKLLIADGEAKISNKKYKEAYKVFKEARKIAHRAELVIDKWQLFEVRNIDLNRDGEVDFKDFKKKEKEDEIKEDREQKENERENEKDRIEKERENEKDRIENEKENEKDRIEKERENEKNKVESERENNKNKSEASENSEGQKDKETEGN